MTTDPTKEMQMNKCLLLSLAAVILCLAAAQEAPAQDAKPQPPASVLPDKDPAAEKPVALVPELKDVHPRLLFAAADIPAMKAKAAGAGKPFFDMMVKYLPDCVAPAKKDYQTDATDGQRQGLWRLPTVALHYVLTGDKKSLETSVAFMKALMDVEDWETGQERNSGMSSANVMIGMALAYDWLYNDLELGFREAMRKCLWKHARWQYHGGHLQKNPGVGYWQSDPQNNHRFHRDAGMVLAALAATTGAPEEQWFLGKVRDEVQFISDWLPDDGTTHESPSYMIFGNAHLTLFMQAAQRCYGTKFLDHPFFKNNPLFRMEICTPGLRDIFDYGDAGGLGSYNSYVWELTGYHKLKDEQAGLWKMFEGDNDAFMFGWMSMVWLDPSITGGAVANLPRNELFPDIGIVVCRDGWEANSVGAMFKCAPYGGHKLNEYINKNDFHYVNVAHDDPDAGMFGLYAGGAKVAMDDGYSGKKLTSSHNTILVNGKGQKQEGGEWTQPIRNTDMSKLAYMVTYKASDDIVIAEGEAAGMYPDLDRFRRTFIWVKGSYVLFLDDIRAKKEADFTWLVQGTGAEVVDAKAGQFRLTGGGRRATSPASADVFVAGDLQSAATVATSTADNKGVSMNLKQVQLKAKGQTWRLASVFDLWKHEKLTVTTKKNGEATEVIVTGPDFTDTWTWGSAADATTPTPLKGERKGGWTVTVSDKDKAPAGLAVNPVGNTEKKP
jgi:hypothetical protein